MRSSGAEWALPPLVSVVLPVYNAAPFLDQALLSIRGQTLKDIEIICIDDGSTDESQSILERHAKQDNRLTVHRQSNRGAGTARNKGLKEAIGQFIWFPDADDFYESHLLFKAVATLRATKTDFVCVGCDFYDDRRKMFTPFPQSIRRDLLPVGSICFNYKDVIQDCFSVLSAWAWDKVYNRQFILGSNLAFDDLRSSNDLRFVLGATLRAQQISILPEVLAHYRRNVRNSVSDSRESNHESSFMAIARLKADLCLWGIFSEIEADFRNFAIFFLLWHLDHLRWPTYHEFLGKMRSQWLQQLGLSTMVRKDFYYRHVFDEYSAILKHYSWCLKVRSLFRRMRGRYIGLELW
jgi:glycosyltransferase involved in cell wall biosynthesis